jgi:Uma2 family endonuclease
MGQAALKLGYSVNEYLELEQSTNIKYEYHEGEVFAMAGGTVNHSLIGSNVQGELRALLKNKTCKSYNSDLRVAISPFKYLYPDAAVVCGKPENFNENPHAVNNPILIVEVVSADSESYDRGEKFWLYRKIASLQDYIIVSQDKPVVDVFSRNENDLWQIKSYRGLDKVLEIPCLNITINMAEIYDSILFEDLFLEE